MTPREFSLCASGTFDRQIFLQEDAWKRAIMMVNVHLPKGKQINPNKVSRKKGKPRLPTREETEALVKKWR